jgi:hypothetical protein
MHPDGQATAITPPASRGRTYRYYDLILGGFVAVLLCSNLVGASKVAAFGSFTFGAGILFFPLSYVFGDVLTEVYGYARSRRVVWAGFAALLFATVMTTMVVSLPPAPDFTGQAAMEKVFGGTWRIALACLVGYSAGEFTNSYVLAKMKVWTNGRRLWMRTIGSTIAGEAVDSLLFYPIAFLGEADWTTEKVLKVMVANYGLKVLWEVLLTPVTYRVVAWLKRAENEDYYDRDTDFTPFKL